jgi:polyphosphate glucokinase
LSGGAISRRNLSLQEWAQEFNEYMEYLNLLLRPDLFILGGGVCTSFDVFRPWLKVKVPIVRAQFHNEAGIIGAAMFADYQGKPI